MTVGGTGVAAAAVSAGVAAAAGSVGVAAAAGVFDVEMVGIAEIAGDPSMLADGEASIAPFAGERLPARANAQSLVQCIVCVVLQVW